MVSPISKTTLRFIVASEIRIFRAEIREGWLGFLNRIEVKIEINRREKISHTRTLGQEAPTAHEYEI